MEQVKMTKPSVLIVDDDEDTLILVQHRLSAEGFDPICSPNGARIMDIIKWKHPDIILLDIRMDGVDGGSICHEIKSDPEIAQIPVVMFSANENIATIARECGADAYITKPFIPESFKTLFKQLLPDLPARA
jgi:CheY-like chemotaxis protein